MRAAYFKEHGGSDKILYGNDYPDPQPGPGEALVSETVRDLTRTVLPVRYESRGRRKLKGIAEPIAVFAAFEAGSGASAWPAFARPRSRTRVLALFGVGVLAVLVIGAAGWSRLRFATGLPPGALKIAVAVDLSGNPASRGQPTIDGVKLAFTTDSYVVSPIFFPGGNIGDLAINGTVNDLAMSGARPLYLSAGFILEEGFAIDDLKRKLCPDFKELVTMYEKVLGRSLPDHYSLYGVCG